MPRGFLPVAADALDAPARVVDSGTVGLRIRMGPVSVSSRGRVGVNAGPVSVYGGGGRRRKNSGGSAGFGVFLLVVIGVGLAVKYWYVAAPIAILALVIYVGNRKAQKEREAQMEADREVERVRAQEAAVEAERRRAEEEADRLATWLAAPPPPLALPTRFTETWLSREVPRLHPGQVPELLAALHSRGWTDDRIDDRVARYLTANPHLDTAA